MDYGIKFDDSEDSLGGDDHYLYFCNDEGEADRIICEWKDIYAFIAGALEACHRAGKEPKDSPSVPADG